MRNTGKVQAGRKTTPEAAPPREWPEWLERLVARYKSGSRAKQLWADRAGEMILDLLDLSDRSLAEATAGAADSFDAVLRAMKSPEAMKLLGSDHLRSAIMRWVAARNQIIRENGGLWSAEKVSEFLEITVEAVNKRRVSRKLFIPRWRSTEFCIRRAMIRAVPRSRCMTAPKAWRTVASPGMPPTRRAATASC